MPKQYAEERELLRSYIPRSLKKALDEHLLGVDASAANPGKVRSGAQSELVTKLIRLYMAGRIPLNNPKNPEPNDNVYGSLPREMQQDLWS